MFSGRGLYVESFGMLPVNFGRCSYKVEVGFVVLGFVLGYVGVHPSVSGWVPHEQPRQFGNEDDLVGSELRVHTEHSLCDGVGICA